MDPRLKLGLIGGGVGAVLVSFVVLAFLYGASVLAIALAIAGFVVPVVLGWVAQALLRRSKWPAYLSYLLALSVAVVLHTANHQSTGLLGDLIALVPAAVFLGGLFDGGVKLVQGYRQAAES